jgi:hypothetical protein
MGLLKKLFGTKPAATGGSGISVLMIAMKQGGVGTQRCGIDGRTFPSLNMRQTIMTATIGDWKLDVGGYCPGCSEYRCPDHAEFSGSEFKYAIVCGRCGTELQPGP